MSCLKRYIRTSPQFNLNELNTSGVKAPLNSEGTGRLLWLVKSALSIKSFKTRLKAYFQSSVFEFIRVFLLIASPVPFLGHDCVCFAPPNITSFLFISVFSCFFPHSSFNTALKFKELYAVLYTCTVTPSKRIQSVSSSQVLLIKCT